MWNVYNTAFYSLPVLFCVFYSPTVVVVAEINLYMLQLLGPYNPNTKL